MWSRIISYQEKNYLRWDKFTLSGIVLLIFCGLKVTWDLSAYMDVLFWDEALYLQRGVDMFDKIPKTWGPSYSLWYKCWSFIIHDKVTLYYFNFGFTTIAISVLFFLLLMSVGVQRVLAFLLALFFLSSHVNLPLWPRVSHYCVIVLVTGILLSKYQRSLAARWAVLSFALLVAAYARPEMFLAFLVSFTLSILFLLVAIKNATKKDMLLIGSLVVVFVFIYIFFKTPFNNGDSGRGLRVFLQHFAWNYTEWHQLQNVFWLDFPHMIAEHFPDSSSLSGIISSNPEMFRTHITSNISNYFLEMGKLVFAFFAPIFTEKLHWLCLMVGIMLYVIYFSFTKTSQNKRLRFKILLKDNIITVFVLALFAFPSVLASIYAYPRQHYLLLQVPVLIVLAGIAISSISVEIEKSTQKISVMAVVWFFVTPVAEDFRYFDLFRKEDSMCNIETVNYIKKYIRTEDTVRLFDVEGYMSNLLPEHFTDYNDTYYRNMDSIVLSDFIREKQIDIIYKTPSLLLLHSVQSDSVMQDLLKDPEKYGFFEQKTGNFEPSLLIRKGVQ